MTAMRGADGPTGMAGRPLPPHKAYPAPLPPLPTAAKSARRMPAPTSRRRGPLPPASRAVLLAVAASALASASAGGGLASAAFVLAPPPAAATLGPACRGRPFAPPPLALGGDANANTNANTNANANAADAGVGGADLDRMEEALEAAALGRGGTYPNPAVGCVLVREGGGERDGEGEVLGRGFHPRAGMPHAEVFALLEASGHVEDGLEAARAVRGEVPGEGGADAGLGRRVLELLDSYASEGGAAELFGGALLQDRDGDWDATTVTAYVTLEPCCHRGRTPPCATSLVEAGVDRVVVGYRDPNPRVDGGGVAMLREAGIAVDVLEGDGGGAGGGREGRLAYRCAEMVRCFAKRIAPRPDPGVADYGSTMNGARRRALRSLAGRALADGMLAEAAWPGRAEGGGVPAVRVGGEGESGGGTDGTDGLEERVRALSLPPGWMEHLDGMLWDREVVLLRLGRAIKKKKGAKVLGERIAEELGAHVAQVKGHTVLLYRPDEPPVLDLDELVGGGGGGGGGSD